jgi:hypothetical protein
MVQLMAETGSGMPSNSGQLSIAGELSPGGTILIPSDRDHAMWIAFATLSPGITVLYCPTDMIELRSGISFQSFECRGVYSHPQPYMVEMKLHTKTESIRIPLSVNWNALSLGKMDTIYIGAGAYMDGISYAKLKTEEIYVSDEFIRSRSIVDEMGRFCPGISVQVGLKNDRYRYELHAWHDVQSFTLHETEDVRYHRMGIMMNFAVTFFESTIKK